MAERTWLTVILCCAVWFAYIKWFAPPPPAAPTGEKVSASSNSPESSPSEIPSTKNGVTLPYFDQKPVLFDSVKVDTGKMLVTLSDMGGKIGRVSLTGFRNDILPDSSLIEPLTPESTPFSLGTYFSDPELQRLATSHFDREQQGFNISFHASLDSLKLSKKYRFSQGSYLVESSYTIQLPQGQKKDWGYLVIPIGGTSLKFDAQDPLHSWEVVAYQNESITRKSEDKLKELEEVQQGNTSWLSFGNRYFATLLLNDSSINPDIVYSRSADFSGAYLRYPLRPSNGENVLNFSLRQYIGPKDYADLSKFPGGKHLINYGIFSVIAYPLLELLKFFYKLCHNYGVAIIILTVFVRLLFYPLSAKGARSMKSMQKLQPQIQLLKEKHKDDLPRFNQEQMALFKAHKVNPMGGCFPLLLQLPVFIALYAVLGYSIELFHAPFIGWIHDLSAKDPYYLLPVLMGLSMLVQQKLTATTMVDPMQQKMMYLMPVLMTFFMVKLPSGLTLYIFLSTLLGIVQQMAINREGGEPSPSPKLVRTKAQEASNK